MAADFAVKIRYDFQATELGSDRPSYLKRLRRQFFQLMLWLRFEVRPLSFADLLAKIPSAASGLTSVADEVSSGIGTLIWYRFRFVFLCFLSSHQLVQCHHQGHRQTWFQEFRERAEHGYSGV